MKRTGIEPATLRLQSYSSEFQDLIGVESSTIEPPLHLEKEGQNFVTSSLHVFYLSEGGKLGDTVRKV